MGIIAEREARRIIVLHCNGCGLGSPGGGGGVKDNDALAWKAWPLQLEQQETSAELAS